MYTTTRHFYPNGKEGEEMDCTYMSFESLDTAILYCHRYAKGKRFAGVQVEDDFGNVVYEITSDFEVCDYRN